MFCVGLELPLAVLQQHWRKSLFISLAGIAVPFGLGAACAVPVFLVFPSEKGSLVGTLLFCGVVTSITAFPVLARILAELRIMDTNAGGTQGGEGVASWGTRKCITRLHPPWLLPATAMNAAAVDDVIAWCILAVVLAIVRASAPITALYTILSTLGVVLLMALVVRPALAWIFYWLEARDRGDGASVAAKTTQLVLVIGVAPLPETRPECCSFHARSAVLMMLSAWVTEILGVDSIFGAFLTGVITPRAGNAHLAIGHKIEPLTLALFLPLYFTFSGIRTEFSSLATGEAWGVVLLVIAAAFAGKLGGCAAAARFMGLPWREAVVIGGLMNARGLVGLIVLNIGLSNGVVSQSAFTCEEAVGGFANPHALD